MSSESLTDEPGWRQSVVAGLAGDQEQQANAILEIALNGADRKWVEAILRKQLAESIDPQIRGLAATSLGHVARLHGAIESASVQLLTQLASDPEVGPRAQDAMEDIRIFAERPND